MRTACIIIDLDGTVYRGDQLIDHTEPFLTMLNENNVNYKFFTNCSRRTPKELAVFLKEMGLKVKDSNIITSGCIVRKYIQCVDKRPLVYVVGSDSFKDYLHAGNVEIVNTPNKVADYVVVGFCTDFTYESLACALWHIQKGAKLITTNVDDVIPFGVDTVPHTGAICAFLEYASKQKPLNLGKPSQYAGDYFRDIFDSDAVFVVGDRIDTDMLFARNNGFVGCLVMTGITSPKDIEIPKEHFFHIFCNLLDLSKFIRTQI